MKKVYAGKIPYDQKHNRLLHYVDIWSTIEWRDNEPFRAKMKVVSVNRGRSAAYFELRSDEGVIYPMFMTDMFDMVTLTVVKKGVVSGSWVGCKRGENYGIRFLEP